MSAPYVPADGSRSGEFEYDYDDSRGQRLGLASASGNAILQTLWIPAYPVLAMTILTLDIIVMYRLLAYGGRRRAAIAAEERARAGAAH